MEVQFEARKTHLQVQLGAKKLKVQFNARNMEVQFRSRKLEVQFRLERWRYILGLGSLKFSWRPSLRPEILLLLILHISLKNRTFISLENCQSQKYIIILGRHVYSKYTFLYSFITYYRLRPQRQPSFFNCSCKKKMFCYPLNFVGFSWEVGATLL